MNVTLVEEQAPPKPNGSRAIWDLVVEDMQERDRVGRERYGTPLQAHNGRDPLVDAYQEALDKVVYLRQAIEERAAAPDPEALARSFHEAYERLAPSFGYETREASRKPWEDVPEKNRALMIAVCAELGLRAPVTPIPHREAMAAELRRLRAREQELLESNTAGVLRLRAADWHQCVREGFVVFGQRIPPGPPAVPPESELRLGLGLVAEEVVELLESCLGKPSPHDLAAWEAWNNLSLLATEYVVKAPINVDMPEAVDGIADSIYVLLGLAIRLGVDLRPVFELVQAANLKKGSGPVDPATGKKLKPPDFVPPDIAAELRRQGWRCPRCRETGTYEIDMTSHIEDEDGNHLGVVDAGKKLQLDCGCGAPKSSA